MIALDSSALVAIALKEVEADRCKAALEGASRLIMSAVVLAEVSVVAQSRGFDGDIHNLLAGLDVEIIPATAVTAQAVSRAYGKWGKGYHKAALNFVDCFSYVTAKMHDCPLLFVGNDFSQTDIESAL